MELRAIGGDNRRYVMTLLLVSTLLTLVVGPLLALYWLLRPASSVVLWTLKAAAVGAYVAATFYLGLWNMISLYGRYVLLILFAVAAVVGVRRMGEKPMWTMPRGWEWLGPGVAGVVLVVSGIALSSVYTGHQVPPDPVKLSFPLSDGAFYVASGGSHSLVNPHMKVGAPEFKDWRGQLWALDIVQLYPSGNRARGFYPTNLEEYAVFGTSVYSPCDGRVMRVERDLPDLTPPTRDTTNKAGNYVLLRCRDEAYVLLGHLQDDTPTVEAGDSVSVGMRLGAIGNSGNSWEPHLHIHAQRGPGTTKRPLDADPRPMVFGDRFPVRNDVLRPGTDNR